MFVIIFKIIGGIIVTQSNLEKQEAKLKALNQKIISQANLDYTNLSNDQIKLLAQQFSEFLKVKSVDH